MGKYIILEVLTKGDLMIIPDERGGELMPGFYGTGNCIVVEIVWSLFVFDTLLCGSEISCTSVRRTITPLSIWSGFVQFTNNIMSVCPF